MSKFSIILLMIISLFLVSCDNQLPTEESSIKTDEPSMFVYESEDSKDNSVENVEENISEEESEAPIESEMAFLNALALASADNPFVAKDLMFTVSEEEKTAVLNLDYQNYADISTLKNAVLDAEYEGVSIEFTSLSLAGKVDLTNNAKCILTDINGNKKTYDLVINRTVYKLPIVNIKLPDDKNVNSIDRNKTLEMLFSVDCSGLSEFESVPIVEGTIRGRGNSTWKWEKKPYKIKLNEKQSLLGMESNRDWILLSNYADKSLIRNTVAYELGRVLDNVFWSPHQYPVDLFVNGEYRGVYALGEHMEVADGRVEIEEGNTDVDTDYFLEVGGVVSSDIEGTHYFHTDNLLVRFAAFSSPDYETITSEQKSFIKDYYQQAENAIMSGEGYEEYIDVESFVDWILLHELTYNADSCFHRSCFMVKEKGGKIRMGPVWDFDLAFGNYVLDNSKYNDFITHGKNDPEADIQYNWCTYLLKDADFRNLLVERWNEERSELMSVAENTINAYSELLNAGSQQENFGVWKIWDKRAGYQSYKCSAANSYDAQITYLKDFLISRAAWLDENL